MNDGFVNVSKEVLLDEGIPSKMLMVLVYLRLNCDFRYNITTCTKWICTKIGLKPKSGVGNTLDQIRDILYDLRRFQAIDFGDFERSTDMVDITLNPSSEYVHPLPPFVKLEYSEFEKITGCSYQRKDVLLVVFLIIKGMMPYDTKSCQYGYCYAAEQTLLSETNKAVSVSHNTLANLLTILCENGLLAKCSIGGYWLKDDDFRLFPNFYSLGDCPIDEAKCIEIAKEVVETRYGLIIDRFIKPKSETIEPEEPKIKDFDFDAFINDAIKHVSL